MDNDKQKRIEEESVNEQPEKLQEIKGEMDLDDLVHRSAIETEKSGRAVDMDDKVHRIDADNRRHSSLEDPDDRVHQ